MPSPENLLISGLLQHKRKDLLIKGNFSADNISQFKDELLYITESSSVPSIKLFKSKFKHFRINQVPESDIKAIIELCKDSKIRSDLTKVLKKGVNDLDTGVKPIDISSDIETKTRIMNAQFSSVVNITPLSQPELFMERYKDKRKKFKSGESIGVPYGIPTLDKMSGGMHPGELISICARTGVGKTYVMCLMIAAGLLDNKNMEIFSLEMNWDEIWSRILTILSYQINQESVKGGILKNTDINLGKISTKKLQRVIDDIQARIKSQIIVPDIKGKFSIDAAGRRIEQDRPDAAFFDYFGLAENESGNVENWMKAAEASHSAKNIARIYDIPFILGAQLNRGGAQTPTLNHIGITDSIGQDSDKVFMLTEMGTKRNRIQIKSEKFRGGMSGWRVVLDWDVNRGKIKEIRHYMDDSNDS